MILEIIIWAIFVYLEIKNKESSEKIFYTFYGIWMFTILMPFLEIFNIFEIYLIFLLVYIFLLYSIYTDFEIFSVVFEFFLSLKTASKKDHTKIDIELLKVLISYYHSLVNDYRLSVYKWFIKLIDILFLLIWFVSIVIMIYLIIRWNVF